MAHDREGARQPHRFDPAKASLLDDRARFEGLPPGEVIALLDAPQGGLVVDFGTGTGTYALELAAARPDVRVIAFDEQDKMLELLRAKLATRPLGNLTPVMAGSPEARALAGRADRILALNVLHELGDAALRDLAALLRPGGLALLVDWNADVERAHGPPREHVYAPDAAAVRVETFGLRVENRRLFRDHYALLGRSGPAR